VSLRLEAARVPLFEGVRPLVSANKAGGLGTNESHFAPGVRIERPIDDDLMALLYDPQTSGGLLVAIAGESADAAARAFERAGVTASRIGSVLPAEDARIVLT
jgi:selenide,water dikinase